MCYSRRSWASSRHRRGPKPDLPPAMLTNDNRQSGPLHSCPKLGQLDGAPAPIHGGCIVVRNSDDSTAFANCDNGKPVTICYQLFAICEKLPRILTKTNRPLCAGLCAGCRNAGRFLWCGTGAGARIASRSARQRAARFVIVTKAGSCPPVGQLRRHTAAELFGNSERISRPRPPLRHYVALAASVRISDAG